MSRGSFSSSLDDQKPVNGETYLLMKSVEGLMDYIEKQTGLYNDTRKRLVEERLNKPKLQISNEIVFQIDETGPDLELLGKKMHILGDRLRQLKNERASSQKQNDIAFQQLKNENALLREELYKLRNEMLSPKKATK